MMDSFGRIDKLVVPSREISREERFHDYIGRQMKTFPPGPFKSDLPGIRAINFIRPRGALDRESTESMHVLVFREDRAAPDTLLLDRKGILSGRAKYPDFTRDELYEEILRIAEVVCDKTFFTVDDNILPEGEWYRKPGISDDGGTSSAAGYPDPKRLAFIENHPQMMFGFNGINSGFRGYYGFVFPKFILLENRTVGNAVYIFRLDHPIEVESEGAGAERLLKVRRNEDRKRITDRYWKPIAGLTKLQSIKAGAIQIIHPPSDDIAWEEKMTEVINKNLKE